MLLLNYSLKFGYIFDRWRTIVNSLLEKDVGQPKIHRLRVIHLYEWDWNLLLGVKWRALLHHAFDNGLLNEHCTGGVPGKSAPDTVFVKELEYEICRLTRKSLVMFDNDAKACYDRIPCYLGNLIGQKYGLSPKVCIVQGRTMEEARCHLKTKLGISEEFVQHSVGMPWFGSGQGATYSPPKYLFMSSTTFDMFCERAKGATYESPD